jgi:UDP-N-acetylmuramoyl-tripeptide--D-alanyl-D-alanine ligase
MAQHTPARVLTYGLSPEADLWAGEVESVGLEGIRFVFHYQGEEIHARVPLLGRHSVHTALRAALACGGVRLMRSYGLQPYPARRNYTW